MENNFSCNFSLIIRLKSIYAALNTVYDTFSMLLDIEYSCSECYTEVITYVCSSLQMPGVLTCICTLSIKSSSEASACLYSHVIHVVFHCFSGFIGKITLQIPFYRPHSDPWVISMSQLNLIIGPAQSQEYDGEKEREEETERKKRLLKALEDKFKVGGSTSTL